MGIPNRLANGVGNPPDADKFMADYDWLTALLFGSFVANGGLENWNINTSFSDPADGTETADDWINHKSGTSDPVCDVSRESSTKDSGSYSMKFNITSAGSSDSVTGCKQSLNSVARFANETVIFGAEVHADTASKVRLKVTDGTTTQYSTYHSGGSSFELLQAALTVGSSPSELTVSIEIVSDYTGAVYFDSVYIYVIPSQMSTTAREALEFTPFGSFYLQLVGGVMQGDLDMNSNDILNSVYSNYRRPRLVFVSVTSIDVENNTDTSNETKYLFPDGEVRSVTEDTSSTNKYRRFIITSTAEYTSGTEDSGLYTSLSEATNTWYAIYAVKSLIDDTKVVLVGDTTLPSQGNVSTLNSRYGTNGWIYLGMVRNGDNSGATGDILDFHQDGDVTHFKNYTSANSTLKGSGIRIATTASAASITYTLTNGTGTTDIPAHLLHIFATISLGSVSNSQVHYLADASTPNKYFIRVCALQLVMSVWTEQTSYYVSNTGGTSTAQDLFLSGFRDAHLGSHANGRA